MKRSPLALVGLALGSLLGGAVFFPSCGGNTWGGGSCDDPCPNGRLCDTVLGCVECRADSDCPAVEPFCVFGSCRECADSGDCGTGKACWPKDHTCQPACTGNSDCPNDEPICDQATGACVMECAKDSDCGAAQPFCAPNGECGECANNSHCGAAAPFCDPKDGECHECIVDGQCGSNEACNDHHCVFAGPCTQNADCGGDFPACDLATGDCVECVVDADCDNQNRPFCVPGHTCEECAVDTDCDPGQVCNGEFKCQG